MSRGLPTMEFVWTYVLGPVLALLPERWRRASLWYGRVRWERAGTVSGIVEMAAAIAGLGYWYMFEMTRRINQIADMAEAGKLGPAVEENAVRGAALTLWAMSPLTWILFFFFVEGAVRMCAAAFTEREYGSFPLWVVGRILSGIWAPPGSRTGSHMREHAKSIAGSVRERVMVAGLKDMDDELRFQKDGAEEVLEISASRKKDEWDPPKIVRVDDVFYRLEENRVGRGPRPFQYRLRRLEAGVMGRRVLQYRTK
jgi:hypothetical protein